MYNGIFASLIFLVVISIPHSLNKSHKFSRNKSIVNTPFSTIVDVIFLNDIFGIILSLDKCFFVGSINLSSIGSPKEIYAATIDPIDDQSIPSGNSSI